MRIGAHCEGGQHPPPFSKTARQRTPRQRHAARSPDQRRHHRASAVTTVANLTPDRFFPFRAVIIRIITLTGVGFAIKLGELRDVVLRIFIPTTGYRMRNERPTQADVARAAGVSQTTVSIVLNRAKPENVRLSEETRQRVLEALEETGYIVNPIARSLAGHRTNIIGVFGFEPVFGANTDSFYLPFMEGIEQAAESAGRDLLLFSSAARDGSQHHIYRQNENRLRLVDACVLIGNGEPQMELSRLDAEAFPFVFIGRRDVPGVDVPYVTADYFAATCNVIERLHRLGHRSLVYMAASGRVPSSIERLDALHAAAAKFGLKPTVIYNDQPDYLDQMQAAIEHGSTAIAAEPLVDIEALADRLEALGLQLPRDVSVAILGDPINATRSPRYWSGYHLPRQEMGRGAVELLLEMLDNQEVETRHKVMSCTPETGKTVGPPRREASAGTAG